MSLICSSVDIPLRITCTWGSRFTQRKAQDAMLQSGWASFSMASASLESWASRPPRTGSMTIMGMCRSSRTLYSAAVVPYCQSK